MVIDSSALVAIMTGEADSSVYISAILNDPRRIMSAATFVEVSIVLMRWQTGDVTAALDALIETMRIEVLPVDRLQAVLAREAFRRFGKGRHPAALNFGDCFSYALAKQTSEPLLFKGSDFSQTDLRLG